MFSQFNQFKQFLIQLNQYSFFTKHQAMFLKREKMNKILSDCHTIETTTQPSTIQQHRD